MLSRTVAERFAQIHHYMGDCPQCAALCSKLAICPVLNSVLGLAQALCHQRQWKKAKNWSAFVAWTVHHRSWFA